MGLGVSGSIFAQSLFVAGRAINCNNKELYEKYIELAGGKEKASIAIIPT